MIVLVMLAGLLGLIIPAFPGLTVMWLAALGFGVIHGFSTLGIVLFVLLTLLMIGGNVVDNLLMGAGVRKGGAAWASVIVSLVAGILFTLIFPPFGGLIAAPLTMIFGIFFAVREDVGLSVILLFAIPAAVIILGSIVYRMVPSFQLMQGRVDRVNLVLREQIVGQINLSAAGEWSHEQNQPTHGRGSKVRRRLASSTTFATRP